MIRRIKHMAVAVKDVDAAVGAYERRLGIAEPRRVEWSEGKSKEAHFAFGEVEIQLCESTDPDGRFAQHIARWGEGVQHICLEVDDIDQALAEAVEVQRVLNGNALVAGWFCPEFEPGRPPAQP